MSDAREPAKQAGETARAAPPAPPAVPVPAPEPATQRPAATAPIRHNLPGLLVLLLALAVLLTAAVLIFRPFSAPIFVALVAATVSYPSHEWILGKIGARKRGLAAALTCATLVLLVFLPLGWIGWTLAEQFPRGIDFAKEGVGKVHEWVDKQKWLMDQEWFKETWTRLAPILKRVEGEKPASGADSPAGSAAESPGGPVPRGDGNPSAKEAGAAAAGDANGAPGEGDKPAGLSVDAQLLGWATRTIGGVLSNVLGMLIKFTLMLLVLFFFLKDGPQILSSLKKAIPLEEAQQDRVIRTFRQVSRSIIRGSLGTALVQGAIATAAYAIVGLPAVFLGVFTTLAALIPPLGTALVTFPVTVFLFLSDAVWKGVLLLAVSALIGILDNFLRPFLMKGGIRVHPIWLLLSILGALNAFGPMGLLYGPMVLVLLGTFVRLFVEEERAEVQATERAASGS